MAYNKIILEGNLTRDIEIRYSQGGNAIANTAIAVTRKFKKQDGTQGEKVLFVDLTAFSRTAEIMNQFLRRGSHILIDGSLSFDTWEKDGIKRSKHSVTVENMQMLGNKEDNRNNPQATLQNTPPPQQEYRPQTPTQDQSAAIPEIDVTSYEIPFTYIPKCLALVI